MFVSDEELKKAYELLKSSEKVSKYLRVPRRYVRQRLKELGLYRLTSGKYKRTEEHKKIISNSAKARTGEKNPFFNKKHTEAVKSKLSAAAKSRTEKRNPNYKDGSYVRRPRDYKISEMQKLRNFVFNRDKYKCLYCNEKKHLHAHHIIPYWVCKEAYLDVENLVTVCTDCHFKLAHKGNWQHYDETLITESLKSKYIHSERLNEMTPKGEAKVRPTEIHETVEVDRNDQPLSEKIK